MAVERVGRLRVVAGVGLVAAAAVASLAAAVLPGRWAARIDVLRAVTSE